MDVRTDAKIQEMVREAFADCTVFAIAHRLDTIIDYDRIAVLDNGVLAEYGTPSELVDKTGGLLAALVEQAGPSQVCPPHFRRRHPRRLAQVLGEIERPEWHST